MRLLTITEAFPPHDVGGYELRCKDVLDGLARKAHAVCVVTGQCPQQECGAHAGERDVWRFLHPRSTQDGMLRRVVDDAADLRLLEQRINAFRPDILYVWAVQNLSDAIFSYVAHGRIPIAHDEGGGGLAHLARSQRHSVYFYEPRDEGFPKKLAKRCIYLFARALSRNRIQPKWTWPPGMRVCYNSDATRRFSRDNGAPLLGSSVIHSGVDLDQFPYVARDGLHHPIRLLMPGRIKPVKRTLDGIALVRALLQVSLPARLTIVGEVQSQAYLEEIRKTVAASGLGDRVDFLPKTSRSALARLYQEADVCFFPSALEPGLARVPLEAMSSGCLVVTYGKEGSAEIIQHGETGFITPAGDVNAVAKVVQLMAEHPEQLRQVTGNARLQVERKHSLESYVDSIEAFLADVVAEKDPALQ